MEVGQQYIDGAKLKSRRNEQIGLSSRSFEPLAARSGFQHAKARRTHRNDPATRRTHALDRSHGFSRQYVAFRVHELKTPLSAIREGAELMADGAVGTLSQPQVEVARILRENTLRLQRLIEDLLNYHTVQFQRSGLHLNKVELRAVIERVAEAHQLPLRAKEIRLNITCPPITFEADENKLEVILDNLLSNAVKFSPPFSEIM